MRAHFQRYGALYAIIALGATLRLVGIDFAGGVQRARPDEELFLQQALFLFSGDLNPHWARNGWPELYFFLIGAALKIKLIYLELVHGSDVHLGCMYVLNPVELSVPARLVSCLFGTLTIPLTYFFARTIFSPRGRRLGHYAGLAAAAILAANVLHVRDSHFAVSDTTVVFFMTLGLWQLARGIDTRSWRPVLFAAFAFGVGSSVKYTGLAMLAMLALVAMARFFRAGGSARRRWGFAMAMLSLVAFGVGFVVASPHFFEEPAAFWSGLKSHEVRYSDGGARWGYDPERGLAHGITFHGLVTIPTAIGWPLWFLGVLGMLRGLWQARGPLLVVSFFVLFFYGMVLGPSTVMFMRYTQPLFPALAVLALVVPVELIRRYDVDVGELRARVAAVLVVGLAVAMPTYHSVEADIAMTRPDTRDQARAWLVDHLSAGETVVSQGSFIAMPTSDTDVIEQCTNVLPNELRRPAIPFGHASNYGNSMRMGDAGWGPMVREWIIRSADNGQVTQAAYVVQTQPQIRCGQEAPYGRVRALPECFAEVARFSPGPSSCETVYDTFDMYMQPVVWPAGVEYTGPVTVVYENRCER